MTRLSFEHHAEQGSYGEQFRILRPDGETRWIRERAFPIRDADGRVYRMAGVSAAALRQVDDCLQRMTEIDRQLES